MSLATPATDKNQRLLHAGTRVIILTDYIGSSRKSCSNLYRLTDLVSWSDWLRRCGSDSLTHHLGACASGCGTLDVDLDSVTGGDGG